MCGNCPIPDDDPGILSESAANIANVEKTTSIYHSTSESMDTDDRIATEQYYLESMEVPPCKIELVKKCAYKILSGECEFHSLDA